jgi:hypothetical protein
MNLRGAKFYQDYEDDLEELDLPDFDDLYYPLAHLT